MRCSTKGQVWVDIFVGRISCIISPTSNRKKILGKSASSNTKSNSLESGASKTSRRIDEVQTDQKGAKDEVKRPKVLIQVINNGRWSHGPLEESIEGC